MVRHRLAGAGLAVLIVSACSGGTVTGDRGEVTGATAYSKVDGIDTWDLTGQPSEKAFGMQDGDAIYETNEPHRVRIVLPGRTIEMKTDLIDFYHSGGDDYSFRVSSPQQKSREVITVSRDVLRQLDMDGAVADRFAERVTTAPPDQSEVVDAGDDPLPGGRAPMFGSWAVGPNATYTPLATLGRVIFSGSWQRE